VVLRTEIARYKGNKHMHACCFWIRVPHSYTNLLVDVYCAQRWQSAILYEIYCRLSPTPRNDSIHPKAKRILKLGTYLKLDHAYCSHMWLSFLVMFNIESLHMMHLRAWPFLFPSFQRTYYYDSKVTGTIRGH